MTQDRIPMPPPELSEWTQPKKGEHLGTDLWNGTKAVGKLLWRVLITLGIWTWRIGAAIINWMLSWVQSMERKYNKEARKKQ
jgi:hypothetical protein